MSSCPTRTTRDVAERPTDSRLRVVFVCLGNICRSPIAERVAEHAAAAAGVTGVEFSSAGTISEEYDDPMDHRAAAVLKKRGYRYADHRARRITEVQIESADLVVAMEDDHLRSVLELAPDPSKVCLLTSFDPAAVPGSGVPDPWFGSDAGFYDTLTAIEAAMPGLLDRIRELQDAEFSEPS
jgi:protein-tyrosine phosphatase